MAADIKDAPPLYRSESVAVGTLNRADVLARRAEALADLLTTRFAGVTYGTPLSPDGEGGAQLKKAACMPPFFDALDGSLDKIEASLNRLDSLQDRAAL